MVTPRERTTLLLFTGVGIVLLLGSVIAVIAT
jgi:hypothetical protein